MLFWVLSHREGIKHNKCYDPIAITLVKNVGNDANVDKSNSAEISVVLSDLKIRIPQSKVSGGALVERTVRPVATPQNSRAKFPVSLLDSTLENTKDLPGYEAVKLLSDTSEVQFMVNGKSMPLPANAIKDHRDYRFDEDKKIGFYKSFPASRIVLMFLLPNGEEIVRQLIDYRLVNKYMP
jgi:hypothetical protein